jgi:hypothetical protein
VSAATSRPSSSPYDASTKPSATWYSGFSAPFLRVLLEHEGDDQREDDEAPQNEDVNDQAPMLLRTP